MGGHHDNGAPGLLCDYSRLGKRVMAFPIEQKQARALLIPQMFGAYGESDSPVWVKVYDALRNKCGASLGLAQGKYSQSEIKYLVGLCDFFTLPGCMPAPGPSRITSLLC